MNANEEKLRQLTNYIIMTKNEDDRKEMEKERDELLEITAKKG